MVCIHTRGSASAGSRATSFRKSSTGSWPAAPSAQQSTSSPSWSAGSKVEKRAASGANAEGE